MPETESFHNDQPSEGNISNKGLAILMIGALGAGTEMQSLSEFGTHSEFGIGLFVAACSLAIARKAAEFIREHRDYSNIPMDDWPSEILKKIN